MMTAPCPPASRRRSLAGALVLSLAALAGCVDPDPDDASAGLAAVAEGEINYCAKFPPDATGDPNAAACEGTTGEQTAYCHLHTGGPGEDGCDDLPGGPSPQLHCLVPGEAEAGGHVIPVFGGGLDCDEVNAARRERMAASEVPAGTCDEDNHGIEVTLEFPADAADCTCCVVPLTGDDPDIDCSEEDAHCVEVRFGDGCGVPELGEAALETLCAAFERRAEDPYKCMDKTCRYEDDQHCRDRDGNYVPCDMETCCQVEPGMFSPSTVGECLAHGGEDMGPDFEDCFGPGETSAPEPIAVPSRLW